MQEHNSVDEKTLRLKIIETYQIEKMVNIQRHLKGSARRKVVKSAGEMLGTIRTSWRLRERVLGSVHVVEMGKWP